LNAGERLVEVVDLERRAAVGRPATEAEAVDVVPHLFRAVREEDGYRWHPLEFVAVGDASTQAVSAQRWLAADADLLEEIAAFLDRQGAMNVFGLSLDHGREEIECADDEVLLEETDEVSRTLTMRPCRTDLIGKGTPTNWSVKDGQVRMRCTCQRAGDDRHGHFETN
jgi:hypothetical protein